jgi:phospholipid/cholesterol/gamma-HCH transport system substrate-binding protein
MLGNWRREGRDPLLSGRRGTVLAIVAASFVAAVGITSAVIATSGSSSKTYTAMFSEAVGVYPGSNVDILGVPVGTIDSVQPEGTQVKVTMSVNSDVQVPAGADAVVIVPSLIADRYIQLSPAYTGGPQMADGATIPVNHTATPVEVDQLYSSITRFANALGPNGLNKGGAKNGALSNVIDVGAANLNGNGRSFGEMIRGLAQLYSTLQNSQGNFFQTIANLESFTRMLHQNDGQLAQAQTQLANVSSFLSSDRAELAGALNELSTALSEVQGFINNNKAALTSNITKLEAITKLLANQKASLTEALRTFPLAADNVIAAYDPSTGTLDGRGNLLEIELGKCSYITNPNQTGCPASSAPLPLPTTGGAP